MLAHRPPRALPPASEEPQRIAAPAGDLADLLVAYLGQMGVDRVFGVPGGHIEPLYNALARSARNGGVRHVLARHESGAGFMADGYARETGRLGVCCSTAGPGATNLLTSVACAYENHVPMLVITGQSALPVLGRHPLQESSCTGVDILAMFRPCTRYNTLVSHPEQFQHKLASALRHALQGPRGPVHLSLPADVFRSPGAAPAFDLRPLLQPAALVDDAALHRLRQAVLAARRIVLVVGGGCAAAAPLVLQYADAIGALVVSTPDGKGLLDPSHPRYRGVFGFAGHASAEAALQDPLPDLVVAIGASLGELNSGGWSPLLLNSRLVHVDETEENLSRTPMAGLHVRGHLATVFSRLLEGLAAAAPGESARHARRRDYPVPTDARVPATAGPFAAGAPVKPQYLLQELGRRCPPGTCFLADSGNSVGWAIHCLEPAAERRRGERRRDLRLRPRVSGRRRRESPWLRLTMNFAPMGWAIGAAVGTAVAGAGRPVVCITGDGSLLMSGQELSVAVAERLDVVFVVLNDAALGMVRHGQRLAGAEAIGCDLPPTDFAALARALGAQAHVIHSAAELDALDMGALFRRRGPVLLDVRVDPDEVPPMNARLRALAG